MSLRQFCSQYVFPCVCDWAISSKNLHPLGRQCASGSEVKCWRLASGRCWICPFIPWMLSRCMRLMWIQRWLRKHYDGFRKYHFPSSFMCSQANPYQWNIKDSTSQWVPSRSAVLRRCIMQCKKSGRGSVFLDYRLSQDPTVATWQSRLNPIQHVFGDGCHLNRPMDQIICAQPFQVRFIQTFYLEGTPWVMGSLYQ